MSEGERLLLSDAIKTAIESERTILILKNKVRVLAVLCCVLAACCGYLIAR